MKIPPEIIGGVVAGGAVLLVLVVIYRYLLRICRPNEILIFSGRKAASEPARRSICFKVLEAFPARSSFTLM